MAPPYRKQPAQLFALDPAVDAHEFMLGDVPVTLGRDEGCTLIIARSLVSRAHARIERHGPRYFLSDTRSVSGTFVNGRRIDMPHMLADDDVIGLGGPAGLLCFVAPDPTERARQRLRYDEKAATFFVAGRPVSLAPRLFKLLRLLYHHAGEVCLRETCVRAAWDRAYDPATDEESLSRAIL